MAQTIPLPTPRSDAAIVGTAVLRAAAALGLRQKELAAVIGVSPSQLSRAKHAAAQLFPDSAAHDHRVEAALLLIRVYRSLHGIFGDDRAAHERWLRSPNTRLGGVPLELLTTIRGKVRCVDYLDAMRGL
ncbi:MAG: antitoxin Xre/MbcA/ParS toxin-binding domain-containing protein [Planctomycetota bacterium]